MKSGTNETHGAAYEYNIGSYARAQEYFVNASGVKSPLPHLVDNNAGGFVGGHIIKDKLFYFGSYEGDYNRAAVSGLLSMPNATLLSGNFSGSPNPIYDPNTGNQLTGQNRTPFAGNIIPASRFDPVVAKLLPQFPAVSNPNATQNNNFVSQGRFTICTRLTRRWITRPIQNCAFPAVMAISPTTTCSSQFTVRSWVAQVDSHRQARAIICSTAPQWQSLVRRLIS